jgi:Raf kinase inhibitor-like YbhB/YbcL family protein
MTHQAFILSSPAFENGGTIPETYTCTGKGVSPPLHIEGIPNDATSLALVMHDPDAPLGDFLHWSLWGISPMPGDIDEDMVPVDAIEGTNDFGQADYGAPCPPSGTHRYEFDLYALSDQLNLPIGTARQEVEEAIRTQVIAKTTLVGMVGALV